MKIIEKVLIVFGGIALIWIAKDMTGTKIISDLGLVGTAATTTITVLVGALLGRVLARKG